MVPDRSKTSLGLEYFVQEGDELWSADDKQLIELAVDECSELGLIDREDFLRWCRNTHAQGVSGLRSVVQGQPGRSFATILPLSRTFSSSVAMDSIATIIKIIQC